MHSLLCRMTGVYVRILLRIIVSDMIKFTVIFTVVLLYIHAHVTVAKFRIMVISIMALYHIEAPAGYLNRARNSMTSMALAM